MAYMYEVGERGGSFCWQGNLYRVIEMKKKEERKEKGRGVKGGEGGRMTFLSLFFSAISSFPALAACRDSCLEVNF